MKHIRQLAGAAAIAAVAFVHPAAGADKLKMTVGQRGNWDTAVLHLGEKAGIFKKHDLELDIVYTSGAGETLQPIVSGAVDIQHINAVAEQPALRAARCDDLVAVRCAGVVTDQAVGQAHPEIGAVQRQRFDVAAGFEVREERVGRPRRRRFVRRCGRRRCALWGDRLGCARAVAGGRRQQPQRPEQWDRQPDCQADDAVHARAGARADGNPMHMK